MDTEGLIRLCEAIFQTASSRKYKSKTPKVTLGNGIAEWRRKKDITAPVGTAKEKWIRYSKKL